MPRDLASSSWNPATLQVQIRHTKQWKGVSWNLIQEMEPLHGAYGTRPQIHMTRYQNADPCQSSHFFKHGPHFFKQLFLV